MGDLSKHMFDFSNQFTKRFEAEAQRNEVRHKSNEQQFNVLRAQIKGVNAHLGDLEVWKKGVDTQLGHLASSIPRPQGQLPGRTDENPRGQIAAMHLRSGKDLPGRSLEKEKAEEEPRHDIIDPISGR